MPRALFPKFIAFAVVGALCLTTAAHGNPDGTNAVEGASSAASSGPMAVPPPSGGGGGGGGGLPGIPGSSAFSEISRLIDMASNNPTLTTAWLVGSGLTTYFAVSAAGAITRLVKESPMSLVRWTRMARTERYGNRVLEHIRASIPEMTRLGDLHQAHIRATNRHFSNVPDEIPSPMRELISEGKRADFNAMLQQDAILNDLKYRGQAWAEQFLYAAKHDDPRTETLMQEIPNEVRHKELLRQIRPETMYAILIGLDRNKQPTLRKRLTAKPKGKKWVQEYEALLREEHEAAQKVIGYFQSNYVGLKEFFHQMDKLAQGPFAQDDLATPEPVARAIHDSHKDGSIRYEMPGGSDMQSSDGHPAGNVLRNLEAQCLANHSKLVRFKKKNRRAFIATTSAPVGIAAGLLGGFKLLAWANTELKAHNQKTPGEIFQEKETAQKRQEIQKALEVQSVDSVIAEFKAARVAGDPRLLNIYRILREEFRKTLETPNGEFNQTLVEHVAQRAGSAKFTLPLAPRKPENAAYVRSQADKFLHDDEIATEILDKVLGKTGRNKNASLTPKELVEALYRDEKEQSQKKLLIKSASGLFIEHLWATLELDPSSYPVDTSFLRPMIDTIVTRIQEQAAEEKRLAEEAEKKLKQLNSKAAGAKAPPATKSETQAHNIVPTSEALALSGDVLSAAREAVSEPNPLIKKETPRASSDTSPRN